MNKDEYIELKIDEAENEVSDRGGRIGNSQRDNLWKYFGVIYDEIIAPLESKEEAAAKIALKVEEANRALGEAKQLADEQGLCFYFGVEQGMGGTYYGTNFRDWDSSTAICEGEDYWNSSTMECEEGIYLGNWKSSSDDC